MGQLINTIRRLILQEQYLLSIHASERLAERDIVEWQVAEGIARAELLNERSNTQPNPTVEVRQWLPDGSEIKAVWALLPKAEVAMLVTVYLFPKAP